MGVDERLPVVLEDVGAIIVPSALGIPCVFETTPEKEENKRVVLKQALKELLTENQVAVSK